jgi:hypothetical protein
MSNNIAAVLARLGQNLVRTKMKIRLTINEGIRKIYNHQSSGFKEKGNISPATSKK